MEQEKLRGIFNKRTKKLLIDVQEKDKLFERFVELFYHGGFKCAYCNRRMGLKWGDNEISFTIDHVLARSHGGTDNIHNLTFACQSCNSMKGDKDAGWFTDNVIRVKARKQKREQLKARKKGEQDKRTREAFKDIFAMANVKKENESKEA